MKKLSLIFGLALILAIGALMATHRAGDYHLREFRNIKTNFNTYRPSILDRLEGIRGNETKWNYHLRKLEELGVVEHTNFVFTDVPYTEVSSKRIWRAANSNFPASVMFSAKYYATNDVGYGVNPYVLEVWDFPTNTQRWSSFFQANNHNP
jgi:hypothetical protein